MDFVNRLTSSHLRSFWYFASKTNFALIGTFGSLLWATAPGREEADWYRRRLGEYRWTLGVSSKGGGRENTRLTEFAMGMLDLSQGLLKSLPEKPALSRVGSVSEIGSGGEGFGAGLGAGAAGSMRQRSMAEGYGYGFGFGVGGNGSSGGFTIGGSRDGSGNGNGNGSVGGREGERDDAENMRSGLASPTSSVSSSSGGSGSGGFEGFHVSGGGGGTRQGAAGRVRTVEEAY